MADTTARRGAPTESEIAVLGSVLLDPSTMAEVAEQLKPDDFAHEPHRVIFRAMLDLAARQSPIDEVALTAYFKNNGTVANAGGELYVFDIVERTPTSANVMAYARTVREASGVRSLYVAARDAMRMLENGDDAGAVRQRLLSTVAAIDAREPHRFAELGAELKEIISEMERRHESGAAIASTSFVSTGFASLDRALVGWGAGQLILIAARPRMGKTAFAVCAAVNLALDDRRVAFFSAEMTKRELARRALASTAKIRHAKLRAGLFEGDDWTRAMKTSGRFKAARFLIDDQSPISTREIAARATRAHRAERLSAIFIDYAQKIAPPGDKGSTREQQVAQVARDLKNLAKSLGVPVIALAQTNQKGSEDFDQRANDRMLRESDTLFAEADVVMFLKRKYVYDKEADPRDAVMEIVKQRDGEESDVRLDFIGELQRFEDPQPENRSISTPALGGFAHWTDPEREL